MESNGPDAAPVAIEMPPARPWRILAWLAGGMIGGTIAGALGWALCFFVQGARSLTPSYLNGWFVPPLADCLIPGFVLGFIGGGIMCVVVRFWRAGKQPWRAAILWASLLGSVSIVMVTVILLLEESPSVEKVIFLLLHTVGHLIQGAAFGFLAATFVSVAEVWRNRTKPGSEPR